VAVETTHTEHAVGTVGSAIPGGIELLLWKLREEKAQAVELLRVQDGAELSDILDLPPEFFTLFHFGDRASWRALAPDALFWRVTGTTLGTGPRYDECPIVVSEHVGGASRTCGRRVRRLFWKLYS
jgi:hypothetical protein